MRKILLIIIMLGAMVLLGYTVYAGMLNAPSYMELNNKSVQLDNLIASYEVKNTNELSNKQKSMKSQIESYNKKKNEYEEVLERKKQQQATMDAANCYDIDYLWAKVGNHATTLGVELIFDVIKDVTDTNKPEYVLTDLKFTATSLEYISVVDFVKTIEEDEKLGFEIRDFNISVEEVVEDLKKVEITKATFTVYGVAINKATLTGNVQGDENANVADSTANVNNSSAGF